MKKQKPSWEILGSEIRGSFDVWKAIEVGEKVQKMRREAYKININAQFFLVFCRKNTCAYVCVYVCISNRGN